MAGLVGWHKFLDTARVLASRRMLVALLMGFSSGLPLYLLGALLLAWLTLRGTSIEVIGLFALVGLPYAFKFVWSPLLDRYRIPILGRRRGWLLVLQIVLAIGIAALGFVGVPDVNALITANPARILITHPFAPPLAAIPRLAATYVGTVSSLLPGLFAVALTALIVAFFSASQDIMIDAYRRESLGDDREQSLGASLYVWGYRLAMLFATGVGLILAFHIAFREVFYIMAACMGVGMIATLIAREPRQAGAPPKNLIRAVIDPFIAFFNAHGVHATAATGRHSLRISRPLSAAGHFFRIYWPALAILAFILLYKLGDVLALSLATPFYLRMGFTTEEIGVVTKLFGFWATMGGILLGGVLILRIGMLRGLLIFGILQGASSALFAVLTQTGPDTTWLTVVIALQHFADGMGTAALVGFMATLTDRRFTATQFALLTALFAVPRVFLSSITGYMVDSLGWALFFIVCALAAIPGLLLIPALPRSNSKWSEGRQEAT